MEPEMKPIEKLIVSIGALDVGYIAWITFNSVISEVGQLSKLWESLVSFGVPYPELQFAAIIALYFSILVCGVSLVLRRKKLAWLNYAQFPVRVLMVVPTLYPVFYLLAQAGIELSFILSVLLLLTFELARVLAIFRWQRNAT